MASLRSIKLSLLALCVICATPFSGAQAQTQTFTDIAVGDFHICGLTDGGEVDCVTDVNTTRFDAPDDLPLLTDITAGQQHSCGITLDGGAVCWGSAAFGALDVPEFQAPLVSISAGVNHTCAVDEMNRAVCWGLDDNEQLQVPGDGFGENGLGFSTVSASQNTSCGIELDGGISCWSTDPTLLDTSSLSGTFVDLGLFFGNGCGLADTGDIQCWQSSFEPPNNGPYTDLVVSNNVICGLGASQQPDCTINPELNGISFDPSEFETDTQFVSLVGRSATSIVFPDLEQVVNVCGLTPSSTIECLQVSSLVGVPGTEFSQVNSELEIDLNLTAVITGFGTNQVELFWTPLSGLLPITLIEIFRNDELVDTVQAEFSYFDNDFPSLGSATATYRIRATDGNGNVGEFSNTITVDTTNGTVTGDSTFSLGDVTLPPRLIEQVNISFLNVNTFFISWDAPPAGENGVQGYEVRINNETVELTEFNFYLFSGAEPGTCFLVTIAAISEDNTILDFRTDASIPFGNFDRSDCTRG